MEGKKGVPKQGEVDGVRGGSRSREAGKSTRNQAKEQSEAKLA